MADDHSIIIEAKTVIRNLLTQVQNHEFTNAANNFHDSLTIIKPSGDLANKNSWINMISSTDILVISHEFLLWNFVELSSSKDMIYCGYTTNFKIKIIAEDQIEEEKAIFTALLKKNDGQWKIYYLQRTDNMNLPRDAPVPQPFPVE